MASSLFIQVRAIKGQSLSEKRNGECDMIYRNVQHINCTVINVEKLELTFEVCADLREG